MVYVMDFLSWIAANEDLLIKAGSILGMVIAIIVARARGEVAKAVVSGVEASGNKGVMTIIKRDFHPFIGRLASIILTDMVKELKRKQGDVK